MPEFTVTYQGRPYTIEAVRQPTQQEVDAHFAAQSGLFERPKPQPPNDPITGEGVVNAIKNRVLNPSNWSTIGGVVGGLAAAPFTSGMSTLPAMLTAGGGGAMGAGAGDLAGQVVDTKEGAPVTVDPTRTAIEMGKNFLYEALGMGAGRGLKKAGANTYKLGAGTGRPGISQNFPTATQQGLEGGRGTAPILSARGAERVLRRAEKVPKRLIAEAEQKGVQGATPVEVAKRGVGPVLKEAGQRAPFFKEETSAIRDNVKEFLDQWAQKTQVLGGYVEGQPWYNTYRSYPTLPLSKLQDIKIGGANRASEALKAGNAEKFPGLSGRLDKGYSLGAQSSLEARIPGLKQSNRDVQGLIGLNQSLNPSFRTPEELMGMGVDRSVADAISTNANSYMWPRMIGDVAAGAGIGLATGEPLLGGAGALLFHAASSPAALRGVGAGMYLGGRALPNAGRAARLSLDTSPDEDKARMMQEALMGAIRGRR